MRLRDALSSAMPYGHHVGCYHVCASLYRILRSDRNYTLAAHLWQGYKTLHVYWHNEARCPTYGVFFLTYMRFASADSTAEFILLLLVFQRMYHKEL